jgi:hypothetical protein
MGDSPCSRVTIAFMPKKNAPRIFEMFPSQNYWDSVVHFARLDLDAIELGYAEAAKRIANSVSGKDEPSLI